MLKHGNAAVYFSNYLLLSCLEEKKSSSGLWLVCWWCLGAVGTDICTLSLRKWTPHWRAFTDSWSDYEAPPCGLCWPCTHLLEWHIVLRLHCNVCQHGCFCGSSVSWPYSSISSISSCFEPEKKYEKPGYMLQYHLSSKLNPFQRLHIFIFALKGVQNVIA